MTRADNRHGIGLFRAGSTRAGAGLRHLIRPMRMRKRWKRVLVTVRISSAICAILGLAIAAPANGAENGAINWSFTPYLWATETKFDLTANGTPIGGGTVTFSDLVDTTDASLQVFVEGGREGGNWSAFIDLTYLDTSDEVDVVAVRIETDSEQLIIDAAIAYWPQGEAGGLNLFGGIRYTSLDDRFTFIDSGTGVTLATLTNDRGFTDLLLGGWYRFDFNGRWSILTHVDYAFGDSDGIFQLQALIRYAVGRNRQHGILIGYTYKEAELEDGGLEEDYEYKGPVACFNFGF